MSDFSIYFAHPKFSPAQVERANQVLAVLKEVVDEVQSRDRLTIKILDPFEYSPAIEGDRDTKKILGKSVLKVNKELIQRSSLVVAIIDDRDTGVIWECGYANALNVDIITVSFENHDNNIMLAESMLSHLPVFDSVAHNNLKNIIAALVRVY